jgi:hypothetical protein
MALSRIRTQAADRNADSTRSARPRRARAAAAAVAAAAATMAVLGGTAFAASAPVHRVHPVPVPAPVVQLNCAASPHVCGYPDATNTGVQPGQALVAVPGQETSGPGWAWNASWGTIEVTGAGAVLSDLAVAGTVDVDASNVTLDNLQVTTGGNIWAVGLSHADGTLIEHCSISSPAASGALRLQAGIKDIYGDTTGTVIKDDNIWHAEGGIALSAGLIEGNYIHDFAYQAGDHTDGIISNAGSAAGLTITGNTILNALTQTDDIALFQNFGPQMNASITGNLLAGGGYSIYGGGSSLPGATTPADITITGNRFSPLYYPTGGYYGTSAYTAAGVNGNTWTGNTWDNTGATVNP